MRRKLKQIMYGGLKRPFSAIFIRLGKKRGFGKYYEDSWTMLVRCVKYKNKLVAGHLWIECEDPSVCSQFKEGDTILFNAKIQPYSKGYRGKSLNGYLYKRPEKDYMLTDVSSIRPISGIYEPGVADEALSKREEFVPAIAPTITVECL